MMPRMRFLILSLSLIAAAAQAQEPLTLRLTEAEKRELLSGKAERDVAALPDAPLLNDRRPHGEVGVMIGTGGARGIYGVTSVPLGENGWATFGFENSRNVWPYRY